MLAYLVFDNSIFKKILDYCDQIGYNFHDIRTSIKLKKKTNIKNKPDFAVT